MSTDLTDDHYSSTKGHVLRAATSSAPPPSRAVRLIALAAFFGAFVALTPASVAFADDGDPLPGTPIMREADRGTPMLGTGGVHESTKMPDAHGIFVSVQGGNSSKGAPIPIGDGNLRAMPTIGGENGVICSHGQSINSKMIPCFG